MVDIAQVQTTTLKTGRFLRYQDRETVLRAGFELKDTEYMILQDFPEEIIERRRKQMPKLKEDKKKCPKSILW